MADPLTITSLQNPRIKDLVRLRDRSGRARQDLMLIEETRVIRRALAAGHPLRTLFACPPMLDTDAAALHADLSGSPGLEIIHLPPHVMEKVAYRHNPEGLLATAPRLDYRLEDLDLPAAPLLLVLESVEKPGNLGAILRTANGAGVDAVLVCGKSVDLCNPNVLRASTGVVFETPTVAMETRDLLDVLQRRGVRIVATTPDADLPYTDLDLSGPVAIVAGAEHAGLSAEWLDAADSRVAIPMHGAADSLNLSVSAALLVYEAEKQRRRGGLRSGD